MQMSELGWSFKCSWVKCARGCALIIAGRFVCVNLGLIVSTVMDDDDGGRLLIIFDV